MSKSRKTETPNRPTQNGFDNINSNATSTEVVSEKLTSSSVLNGQKKSPINWDWLNNISIVIGLLIIIGGFIVAFWINVDTLKYNDKEINDSVNRLDKNTSDKIEKLDQKFEKISDDIKDIKYNTESIKDNTIKKK